ncbi:hypothetical protein Tco_0141748, partial [Tanacetum coccineum]
LGAGRLIDTEREDLDFKEEKRKPLTNAKLESRRD